MSWTHNFHATCIEKGQVCKAVWPVCPVGKSDVIAKYITGSGPFKVHAESGKVLGSHDTRAEAEAQLRAIEANKHKTEKAWSDEARAAAAEARRNNAANRGGNPLPGRTRRDSERATRNGWQASDNPDPLNDTAAHYTHPSRPGERLRLSPSGQWEHSDAQGNKTTGLQGDKHIPWGESYKKSEEIAPDETTIECLKSAWQSFATEIGLVFKSEEVMAEPIEPTVFRIEAAGKRAYFRVENGQATRIDYHQKASLVPVQKAEKMRYTLGAVYAPGEVDFHGDTMTEVEIEKAAWAFTKKDGLTGRVGLMHQSGTDKAGEVVESYVYRGPKWTFKDMKGVEQTIVPGTWMLGVVWTPESWVKVERGQINGFSLQGVARKFANGEEV